MKYFIATNNRGEYYGVACQPYEQQTAFLAMFDATGSSLVFKPVSRDVYDNTVTDLRYEDGEVQQ